MCSFYNNSVSSCKNIYNYFKDYLYGHHDTWAFIYGHTLPQSINNIYNEVHAIWVYDNNDNTLKYITNDNLINVCKISWLSAKIQVTDSDNPEDTHTYEIDDFIEKLSVRTVKDVIPTLYVIFLCWCIYTKHWFDHSSIIQIHIIDDMADEHVLTFKDHNFSFAIKRNQMYIDHSPKEETTEEMNEVEEPVTEETPLKEEDEKKNE
jgi:hypothetical protein